jgi:hypothetical protein
MGCFEACLDFQAGNPDYASLKKDDWMLDISGYICLGKSSRWQWKSTDSVMCEQSSSANVWTASFWKGTILTCSGQELEPYTKYHPFDFEDRICWFKHHMAIHDTSQYIAIHHNTMQLAKRARTDTELPVWSGDSLEQWNRTARKAQRRARKLVLASLELSRRSSNVWILVIFCKLL